MNFIFARIRYVLAAMVALTAGGCGDDACTSQCTTGDTNMTNITNVTQGITQGNITNETIEPTTPTTTGAPNDECENNNDCSTEFGATSEAVPFCLEDTNVGTCVGCFNNSQCSGCCDLDTNQCADVCPQSDMTSSTGPT